MNSSAIDIHNIDEGLDRKQLQRIKQRFLALNQQRFERAYSSLSDRQQQFMLLLPLLFHVNHPMLPGYVSGTTPAGVFGYKPDKEVLRLAKILSRSFQYTRDISDKNSGIDALFIMGSVGSIAHSEKSDLDIWVCHNPALSEYAQHELNEKCELISRWAAQQINLEVHFFLMTGEGFQAGRLSSLTSEASGSAQHYLLLDEFYRTALWIAGKTPLWWYVPSSRELDYVNYTEQLITKRFINGNDVIDFGGIPEIPANEFIGAGIWQLYKAIESPYKSVLKLLLLEVYANASHVTEEPYQYLPLALAFKQSVYAADPQADALDAYVMVYQRVSAYLKALKLFDRLELVRRCFYFKVNIALSKKSHNRPRVWRRDMLEAMVAKWNWTDAQLLMLDNRAIWKSPHVISERGLLVNELSHSYQLLSALNKRLDLNAAISADELMILGRKLHAAFERKAGKIEWINPGISKDLSEPSLCFVQVLGKTMAEESWQVLRGSQRDVNLRSVDIEPVKRARSLMELLLWCHINGLLVQGTKVDIVSTQCQLTNIQKQQLLTRLEQWVPEKKVGDYHNYFTRAAQVEELLLVVNLGVEPQAELHKKGMQMLSNQRDALGYSGFKENLVVKIDVVSRNSWGEFVVRHFNQDALVNSLLHYLRFLPPNKTNRLPHLAIDCFTQGQGSNIANRLTELWRDIIACFYSGTGPCASRYIFEMSGEYFLLQFLHQQPYISRYKTYENLLDKLSQPQLEYSPIVVDTYALRDKPLRLMAQTLKTPGIYVFYQVQGGLATVSVFDERGSLFMSTMVYFTQVTFLRPLIGFIQNCVLHQRWSELQAKVLDAPLIRVYEIEPLAHVATSGSRLLPLQLHERELQEASEGGYPLKISVIAEPDAQGGIGYSILCNEKEFSSLVYGDDLFAEVATHIMNYRAQGERYPCYITDLDLSQCRDIIAQQADLQLNHYLNIKADLESRLTRALLNVH